MLGPIKAEKTDYDVPTIACHVAERIIGKHFPKEPEYDDKYDKRQLIKESGGVGEKAIPILIDILKRGTVDEKRSAVIALGNIRDAHAVELLIKALEDVDTNRSAIYALGINGDTRAIKPLIDQIAKIRINSIQDIYSKMHDYSVLLEITDALIKIGEPAIEPLITALEDRYWLVRWVAVSALWKIGDSRAIEPLIKVLSDEHFDVRGQATYVLVEIGDARALDPLTERLSDSDINIRRIAKEALDTITLRLGAEGNKEAVNKEALRWAFMMS
jgi:HEAT repeat protein